jgi:hypothetical protein
LFSVKTAEVQLCCAAIDPKTGSLVAGSPRVISKHDTGWTLGSPAAANSDGRMSAVRLGTATTGVDSVIDFTCAQSRTGHYILTVFRQMKGGSIQNAEVVLNATAQETYMDPSVAAPAMDVRFAAAPIQVNAGAAAHPLSVPGLNSTESDAAAGTVVCAAGYNGNTRTGTPRSLFGNGLAFISQVWQRGTIANDTMAAAVGFSIGIGNIQGLLAGSAQGTKGIAVVQFRLQENLGFGCGIQSDVSKMNVLWTLVDGTEDQLYVANIQTTLGTTVPTPTLVSQPEKEITAPALVHGPAIYNTFDAARNMKGNGGTAGDPPGALKSTFKWLPGSIGLATDVKAVDLGVDATQPNAVGGGVLVFFWRIDDASRDDGDNFDAEIYAASYDGTAVSPAVRCARSFKEDTTGFPAQATPSGVITGGAGDFIGTGIFGANSIFCRFRSLLTTSLQNVIVTPRKGLSSGDSFSADSATLVFTAPSADADNGTKEVGLFARKWDETIRRSASTSTTTLDQQFIPPAGVGATKATDAIRLSREETSGDLRLVDTLVAGSHIAIIFQQDRHLWVTQTDDSVKWSADGNGLPNPPLFDNNTTSDYFQASYRSCHKADGCDDFHGSISLFVKADISGKGGPGTPRAFVRTWN